MTASFPYPTDPARISTVLSPGTFRDESVSVASLPYAPPSRDTAPYAPPAAPTPENCYERPASQEARVSAPAPESEDGQSSEPVLRSAETPAQVHRASLSETAPSPDTSPTSVPPFMRTKEWEVEDLTDDEYLATLERNWWSSEDEKDYGSMPLAILRQRPSVRKPIPPRVFPKSVSVFGSRHEGDTCLRRFEVPLGGWGAYFPLKLVSDTLGLSPILVERVMRRVTRDSGIDVFLDAYETAILEPKAGVTIGMMTPESLVEHFGYRDRILVDAFACFWALPELMRAKKRADAQKAARRRRAAETADEQDNWQDAHDDRSDEENRYARDDG